MAPLFPGSRAALLRFFGGQRDKAKKTQTLRQREKESGTQEKSELKQKSMAPVSPMLTGHPVQETSPRGPGATREGVCELNSPVSLDGRVQDKSPVVLLSP